MPFLPRTLWPAVLQAAHSVAVGAAVEGLVDGLGEGLGDATALEPCFTQVNFPLTFLHTNFEPETTLTALTLAQEPLAFDGAIPTAPKTNPSAKKADPKTLREPEKVLRKLGF